MANRNEASPEGTHTQTCAAWGLSRRDLFKALGLVLVESQLSACEVSAPITRTRSFDVIRPADRLWLHVDCFNLDLDATAPADAPRLSRVHATDAYLVVTFPPQALGEQALTVDQNGQPVVPNGFGGIQARLAGPSRLAFLVPEGVTIPYTIEGVLDWSRLTPSLVPVAQGPTWLTPLPALRAPSPTETALELPWWLVLSPHADARWAHATAPVTRNGRTELWHTRLGRAGTSGVDESWNSGLRAVWARDRGLRTWLDTRTFTDDPQQEGQPFLMSATPSHRYRAVRNTSERMGSQSGGGTMLLAYRPEPFAVPYLHLSSLGATALLEGAWNPPPAFGGLVEWTHRLSGGRDTFVRIVERGFLYPLGHQAVQVTLTERAFGRIGAASERSAHLRQRTFFVVTERRRAYPGAPGLDYEGRAFPFREVEVLTRQTADVVGKRVLRGVMPNPFAYQPTEDPDGLGAPLLLECLGTDWTGRVVPFRSPFAFVSEAEVVGGVALPYDPVRMEQVADAFAGIAPQHRTAHLSGQKVAFAAEATPDDTSFELHELVLGARKVAQDATEPVLQAARQVAGFPQMVEAVVKLPAMQALAGAKDLTSRLGWVEQYLKDGFGQTNPGAAFLQFVGGKALEAATDATGGLMTPNQVLTAITRTLGPVGGQLGDIVNDTWKPDDVFGSFGKLLGGVPLKDIIQLVQGVRGKVDEALKWVEQRRPTEVVASFHWKPKLKADPLGIFNPTSSTIAVFEGEARQSLKNPGERSAKASGVLTDFELKLLGRDALFLRLDIAAVRFKAGTGQKTTLDVTVRKVVFDGALSFVEALRPFLEALGQGPSSLPIPQGIEVTAGLQIPKVQVGVFQLANLGFDAKLVVPFTGAPARFRFRFASRENPFTVSVAVFGGTGYFALGVGGDGIELVEVALEFGGMLALDVGVASGSVKAVAGIYIKVEKPMGQERVELSGYLKLTGQLQVLGIISVSILLDLSFQYLRKPAQPVPLEIVTGRARCEIKVTIVLFTISVGFEVEKSFGGDPADPTVADQFTLPDWQEYADAFA